MKRSNGFQTIRSEGGLLPPDLLRRVLDPREKLPGTLPEDYGLPKGERLNEVITQSWNRLRKHWAEFQTALGAIGELRIANRANGTRPIAPPHHSPGTEGALTGLTNDKWSLPLLRELGFGLLPTSAGPELGGRTYAINRFFGPVPVHLVGCGLNLDKRTAGARGAATANPHGLVQEFLNRSPGHIWAIVANGLRLRILRDNQALSRQSFLEFDLDAMFTGEIYSDFVLFWLLAHATRFAPQEGERPDSCWLEKWAKEADEQGTRALGDLRGGVERALQILGEGFTSHPKNTALRDALRTGQVPLTDFHGQLLRVVYRLIFLFVAEDRTIDGISLLHPRSERDSGSKENEGDSPIPTSSLPARYSLYSQFYSTTRLRELAGKIKGSRHADLWEQFNLIVGALSGDERFAAVRQHLALPSLGSFLWSPASTAGLNASSLVPDSLTPCSLTNHDFLEALRHLAFTRQGKVLRPVDYENLGAEELGGVYESLLALTPQISADGARFTFAQFAGSERKMSGSYYTPDSLVQCLLDSALDPVVEDRLKEARELASKERASRGRAIYANRVLSRPDRVAEGHGLGGAVLSRDSDVSEGRAVWHDFSDPPGGNVDPGQYRGGLGPGDDWRISSVPPGSTRQHQGTGDPPAAMPAGTATHGGQSGSAPVTGRGDLQDDHFPDWFFAAQKEVGPDSLVPYSLLAEQALLSLRICDPAVGSGHFLVGAAHRLARHLARVRALAQGESEPSPLLYQHALRDVIGRCLYGVDVNPMAAELCRVSLWLEALEPGKPLSFLDHHIRVGNSLLGTTPELIARGLPDEAFNPIEGDDKKLCSALKKLNKQERAGQQSMLHLMVAESQAEYNSIESRTRNLNEAPDDTIEESRRKAEQFARLVVSPEYRHAQLVADTWCAAFVWKKQKAALDPITTDTIQRLERDSEALSEKQRAEVERLAAQYRFFHWHLAFPEVIERGGFNCVLGNPPWERVKIQEKEWFAERSPEIANAPNAASRKSMIWSLRSSDPDLYQQFLEDSRKADGESHLLRHSGQYPLCGRGDINVYAVFAERMRCFLRPGARVGCIVPSGIATDHTTKYFFEDIVARQSLSSIFDFSNRDQLFPSVAVIQAFSLMTLQFPGEAPSRFKFAFGLLAPAELAIHGRILTLSADDLRLVSPLSGTCPTFASHQDQILNMRLYRQFPLLSADGIHRAAYDLEFLAMFHSSNDSDKFVQTFGKTTTALNFVPLYEAKYFQQYDHRHGTFESVPPAGMYRVKAATRYPSLEEKNSPSTLVVPRYVIEKSLVNERLGQRWSRNWMIAFRKTVQALTNARCTVFCLLPCVGATDKAIVVLPRAELPQTAFLLGALNSFIFDYLLQQRLGLSGLSNFVLSQVPTVSPAIAADEIAWWQSPCEWVLSRILELSYTAWDLTPFAQDCGWLGPPFRWDEERRFLLRCELDAAFFHLYLPTSSDGQWKPSRVAEGDVRDETPEELAELTRHFPTPRDAVAYIMDTFPIVRRKDEERHNGDYRTKRVILEIYDAMQDAIRTGQSYQTRLNPPPADPRCCHPKLKRGILAYGSLIGDPGAEIEPRIRMRIKTTTPFPVEFGRYSRVTRGGAPTLVKHDKGGPVAAEILVLDDAVSFDEARDMLSRRERRRVGSGETYIEGTSPNSVLVREISDDPCVSSVLYTDFLDVGKIPQSSAAELAAHAIESVKKLEPGMDGITYLINAIAAGIETPLTPAYKEEILKQTGTHSLEEALRKDGSK
jgi:hypothetical protein